MLEPVAIRALPRLRPSFGTLAALLAGLAVGAAVMLIPDDLPAPRMQAAYSLALDAKLVGLRTDPYRGPTEVLACLVRHGAFCVEQWVSYAAIDAVADLSRLDPYGACVPGCLFVSRDGGAWTCERHVFYLPLASLPW